MWTVASFRPLTPRTSSKTSGPSSLPVSFTAAVRSAASMTPPVAPKMSAAPELIPSGRSKSPSGRAAKSMP